MDTSRHPLIVSGTECMQDVTLFYFGGGEGDALPMQNKCFIVLRCCLLAFGRSDAHSETNYIQFVRLFDEDGFFSSPAVEIEYCTQHPNCSPRTRFWSCVFRNLTLTQDEGSWRGTSSLQRLKEKNQSQSRAKSWPLNKSKGCVTVRQARDGWRGAVPSADLAHRLLSQHILIDSSTMWPIRSRNAATGGTRRVRDEKGWLARTSWWCHFKFK